MKPLRIVFFGTPEFAKHALESIHQSLHEIVGVVTSTDKLAGRGQKIKYSAVKQYALEENLPLFQPEKLRDPEFLEKMKNLKADVFVVVAFRMMPKILFEIPPMGTFNLHASLLPDYRGAAPINYAIMNGETLTGVTTFFINEKIDEGKILLQNQVEITPEDTAGTLHDKLMVTGADTIIETLDGLSLDNLQPKEQKSTIEEKTAYKIFKDDMRIDFNQSSKKVYDFVRGLSPYPSSFTEIEISGEIKSFKIFEGRYEESLIKSEPGTIEADKNALRFSCKDGYYYPLSVQLEGKKRMPVKDFLNGIRNLDEIKTAPNQ